MSCPTKEQILDAVNGVAAGEDVAEHVRRCEPCRAAYDDMMAATEILTQVPFENSDGPCLTEETLLQYSDRILPSSRQRAAEQHVSSCPKCLDDLVALQELPEERTAEIPPTLQTRLQGLQPRTGLSSARVATLRSSRRFQKQSKSVLPWVLGVAAGILAVIVLIVVAGRDKPDLQPAAKKSKGKAPATQNSKPQPNRKKKEPASRGEKKKEEGGAGSNDSEEKNSDTKKIKKPDRKPEKKIEKDPPKKKQPGDTVIVKEPGKRPEKKTEVVPDPDRKFFLTEVKGELYRARERLSSGAEISGKDLLRTSARWPASFILANGDRVWMKAGTDLRVQPLSEKSLVVNLARGEAYFEVAKGKSEFRVRAPHADAIVTGTSFSVLVEKSRSVLSVAEGVVEFENEKGKVVVRARQRSVAVKNRKPGTPRGFDAAKDLGWIQKGDVAVKDTQSPYLLHVKGTNLKLRGIVLSAPYATREVDAYYLARRASDLLGSGLVIGYHLRSPATRTWINVDRGTEKEIADDGSRGKAKKTVRARGFFSEYIRNVRGAARLRKQVPLLVTFREHRETVGKTQRELAVCEVAWHGIQPKTIKRLKKLYEKLLAEYKPVYAMPMKFYLIDARYEFAGEKVKFSYTEGDAKNSGYMEPKYTRKSITFFLNRSFGNPPKDFDVYAKILTKMIEFLYKSR